MARSPLSALLAAACCAVGTLWVYAAAFHLSAAATLDLKVYLGFTSVLEPHSTPLNAFVGLVDPVRFALLAPLVAAIPVVRRNVPLTVATVAVILGANVTTQLLKVVTEGPRAGPAAVVLSWPSGHMTAATALALCLVLVVPGRLRPVTAVVAAVWLLAIAYSILLLGMHLPSDVIAGMLVAGAWMGLALAGLRRRGAAVDQHPVRTAPATLWPAVGTAAAAMAVAAVAAVASGGLPHAEDSAAHRLNLSSGALAIGVVGAALVAATAAAGRRVA
jgi:membrane-associated phospholipid phosphatase